MTKKQSVHPPIIVRNLCNWRDASVLNGPDVVINHGDIVIDAIGHATAEELLRALMGILSETDARKMVEILWANGLTFDATIESELDNP